MPKQCKKGQKVACIITGRTTYFGDQFLAPKLQKYGSIEIFKERFVCNQAKRMLREGKTVEQIREELECPKDLPPVDISFLKNIKILRKRQAAEMEEVVENAGLQKVNEDIQKRVESYKNDIKEYGAFGAYVREMTFSSNGSGVCQRPDIYLNNGERCGKCEYREFCLCKMWNGRKD